MTDPCARRARAAAVAVCGLLLALLQGCPTWEPVPTRERIRDYGAEWVGRTVRLRKGDSARVIEVSRVDYPWIEGTETDWEHRVVPVRLDLREFDGIELKDDNPRAEPVAAFFAALAAGLAGAALLILVLATGRR